MMLSGKCQRAINEDADSESLKSTLKEVGNQLRNRKGLINAEISNYPIPISRCDAQFNHLLEQQTRLSCELERLDTIAARSSVPEDLIKLIEDVSGSLESYSLE